MSAGDDPFTPAVVDAVVAHMNGDHADDCLVICRALGGAGDASAATMVGMDGGGIDFEVTVDGGTRRARVPWGETPQARGQVRLEVVRLYDESRALLGLPPRAPAEH